MGEEVHSTYLATGLEVLTLGENTLVVVDIVLPAVLCPSGGSLLASFVRLVMVAGRL